MELETLFEDIYNTTNNETFKCLESPLDTSQKIPFYLNISHEYDGDQFDKIYESNNRFI